MDLCLDARWVFFVFLLFKFYLEFIFQVKTALLAVAIDIRIDHGVYALKNAFVFPKVF